MLKETPNLWCHRTTAVYRVVPPSPHVITRTDPVLETLYFFITLDDGQGPITHQSSRNLVSCSLNCNVTKTCELKEHSTSANWLRTSRKLWNVSLKAHQRHRGCIQLHDSPLVLKRRAWHNRLLPYSNRLWPRESDNVRTFVSGIFHRHELHCALLISDLV